MSEEVIEEVEVDLDHPWVEASLHATPIPLPTNVKISAVKITQGDQETDSILMTISSPAGVFTFFFPPHAFHNIVVNGAMLLQNLQNQQNSGLIVADKQVEREVIRAAQIAEGMKG